MTRLRASSRRRPFLGFEPMEDRRLLAAQPVDLAIPTRISLAQSEGGGYYQSVTSTNEGHIAFLVCVPGQLHSTPAHALANQATADSLIGSTKPFVSASLNARHAADGVATIPSSPVSKSGEGGHVPIPPVDLGGHATFGLPNAVAAAAFAQPTRPVVRSEMARCVVLHMADRPAGERPASGLAAVVNGRAAPAYRLAGRASIAPAASERRLAIANVRGVEPSEQKVVVPSAQAPVPKPRVPVALVAMRNTSAIGKAASTPPTSIPASTLEATAVHTDPTGEEASLIPPPEPHESRWWIRLVATPAAAMMAVSGAWYVARNSRDRRPTSHPMLRLKGLGRIGS